MIPLSIMGGTKVTKCYINISSDLKKKTLFLHFAAIPDYPVCNHGQVLV